MMPRLRSQNQPTKHRPCLASGCPFWTPPLPVLWLPFFVGCFSSKKRKHAVKQTLGLELLDSLRNEYRFYSYVNASPYDRDIPYDMTDVIV